MGAAVTTREYFPARFEAVCEQHCRTLNRMDVRFIGQEIGQSFRCFIQFVTNKILVHEECPSALMINPSSVTDSGCSEKHSPQLSPPLLIIRATENGNSVSHVVIIL
jgi:hypothetical protein